MDFGGTLGECAERPDYLPDCIVIVQNTRSDYLGGGGRILGGIISMEGIALGVHVVCRQFSLVYDCFRVIEYLRLV